MVLNGLICTQRTHSEHFNGLWQLALVEALNHILGLCTGSKDKKVILFLLFWFQGRWLTKRRHMKTLGCCIKSKVKVLWIYDFKKKKKKNGSNRDRHPKTCQANWVNKSCSTCHRVTQRCSARTCPGFNFIVRQFFISAESGWRRLFCKSTRCHRGGKSQLNDVIITDSKWKMS